MLSGLEQTLSALQQPSTLLEVAALLVCGGLSWLVSVVLRRSAPHLPTESILFGRQIFDGALFPLLLFGLTLAARAVLQPYMTLALLKLTLPILFSLSVIRVGAKVLQAAFPEADLVRSIERSLSWLVWCATALWVTGVLPLVLQEFDDISWKVGSGRMSLRTLLDGALLAMAVLLVALWISSVLESWLLRSATGSALSLRKALSNAVRALLVFIGLIVALSAVGIDLTALSVLGGAIGVGIGLGLQKLAANYVSGFVILAERSIRIGDNVRVDNFEGRITAINGRYTVIQSTSGREAIVPNEMLITSRIENLSLADTRVWLSTVVSVGYDSDVELVMRLLKEAALSAPRVLREPAPSASLSAFGADGLEFTLGFWIADPENGALGLRSQINVAVLQALRAHGIDIPYPQRVVHLPPNAAPSVAPVPPA